MVCTDLALLYPTVAMPPARLAAYRDASLPLPPRSAICACCLTDLDTACLTVRDLSGRDTVREKREHRYALVSYLFRAKDAWSMYTLSPKHGRRGTRRPAIRRREPPASIYIL